METKRTTRAKRLKRLPSFCLSRVATSVARVRPPLTDDNPAPPSAAGVEPEASGRRIMVAVDSSTEAKSALLWALSHAVQSNDSLVLLKVSKPATKHGGDRPPWERDPRGYELLQTMKRICQSKRPEVGVELSLVEGKERGPAIAEEVRKQAAALLVLGQKRRSITWRLLMIWSGGSSRPGGVVDYCVQNASCMTLAVRRKGRRAGGYVITTRRHKDFWLLA